MTRQDKAKSFLNKRWVTISSRIEEYAWIYKEEGSVATRREILRTYGQESFGLVWTGLKVFMEFGADAYYSKDYLKHIANN